MKLFGNISLIKNLFLIILLGLFSLLMLSKHFIQQTSVYEERWKIPKTKQVSTVYFGTC